MAAFYVDFYANWMKAASAGYKTMIVHYDDVRENPHGVLSDVFSFLDINIDHKDAGLVVESLLNDSPKRKRETIRFNVGISGRGAEYGAQDRVFVRSLYAMHPGIDFSAIDSGN